MKLRDLLVVGAVTLAVSGLFTLPAFDRLGGLSIDALFWLRHQVFGPRHSPASSPTAVVAIDEETYRSEPFRSLPKVLWTKQIAAVVDATLGAGATVVGFDVIYPTSVERYLKGFDRELLITLRRASKTGQIVLGKVQHQHRPIVPFPGYSFAVGHSRNIRSVNLFTDGDGVIRRVPLAFRSRAGAEEVSMALEIAARARGTEARRIEDGSLVLGENNIPGSRTNRMAVNFDGGPGAIPTYSLADLSACAQKGDDDYFRRHFEGKVVLVGVVLDVEDRKLTSQRFITAPEGLGLPERCVNPVMSGLYIEGLRRDTIPAVYIHAQAINNLLRGEALRELDRDTAGLIVLGITAAVAVGTMSLSFLSAGVFLLLGFLIWIGIATLGFADAQVLPLLRPLASATVVFAALLGYRFTIADKDKRYIRQAFSLYLPAPVVDRMIAGGKVPALGGETRELTIWFSDIADFTSWSEHMPPAQLVQFLNSYLSEMTDLLDHHGGFVDKYIGDAILAVFGAPVDDSEHALHAVEAALACRNRLEEMSREFSQTLGRPVIARIGINSGQAIVGNIGSRRRFNYTVMGDAVNLASRLEGANKIYGTDILVSDTTVAGCADRIKFREIDLVRVVGRSAPVRIFEPLGLTLADEPTPERVARDTQIARFAAALSAFRSRRFAAAAEAFATLAEADAVAAHFADRARAFAGSPPEEGWDGITNLAEK
jgi:class 3 adenylate cyclase